MFARWLPRKSRGPRIFRQAPRLAGVSKAVAEAASNVQRLVTPKMRMRGERWREDGEREREREAKGNGRRVVVVWAWVWLKGP